MITIKTFDDKVKFDGEIKTVSRRKRNYKSEITIYGAKKTNHTGRGTDFQINVMSVKEIIKDKLIDMFYNADTFSVMDNENGKLYGNMIFEGDSVDVEEVFDYEEDEFFYSFNLKVTSSK